MDVGTGILDLNDYCLQKILHYVDIKGQISFAQACNRFRDVFLVWSRCEYSYVSIIGDVEPMELTLLSLVASNVRKLNIFADDLVSSFNDNYTDLKHHNVVSKFCNLIRTMDSLKSIKLWQVNPHPIVKQILKALVDLPRLRKLYLCIPMRVTINLGMFHRREFVSTPSDILRHCKSLANLRTLHLSDQVSSSNLRDIVKQLPHLKDLSFYIDRSNNWSLFACHRDTRNHLTRILDFLASERKLEILKIKGEINAEHEAKSLASIKSLRSLNCSFASPDLVIYLTELTSLRSLRITLLHDMDITSTYLQSRRSAGRDRVQEHITSPSPRPSQFEFIERVQVKCFGP
ncbi:uncharacterized protein LOC110177523 isoform X2 [Drosophila serrata]|uniref:uncharacterized protein LOC110177523 isoform X2 n=1 Tax=Drosophila serrata TaxID=7274 RepID=UPI000A1D3011|nr:uncharacterized protein LOC110177523 isoform X2 [Drosophila serrata]